MERATDCLKMIRLAGAMVLVTATTLPVAGQSDWRFPGGDPGNTRFSHLSQITNANVGTLKPVWTWDSGETSPSFEVTPLVIDHVMYVSTPQERVVALDADTGEQLWAFDPKVEDYSTHRGVSYWPGDGKSPARLIVGTSSGQIYAVDPRTGKTIPDFGDNGVVDFRKTVAAKYPGVLYGFSSPPAVYKDLIIFGPRTAEGGPKGPDASVRALDVRTGKQVWEFHSLPRPGEPGSETWGPNYFDERGGPSAWAAITVDVAHDMVFVPVGNPTGGGDPASRKGDNLYSDSVVALNASTGKMIWYYQMVHHDMWDYDVTAAPTLIDVTKGGKKIPAVAQITKQGLLFILDRMTGKPVFGVEERPVPPSTTAGEIMSPTQPFPVKPVPLARNSITPDEVSNINPQAAKYCADQVASRAGGVPFAPRNAENGTIIFPSSIGGGNWGGVSYDPALSLVFVNTQDLGSRSNPAAPGGGNGRPAGPRTAAAHGGEGGARFTDEERYPCNRPPWGRLTAVNANTGDIAWQVPLGGYKELEAKGVMGAGAANLGASMVTAGDVLFIGATNDERFRAFDARSGKQLWQVDLDGNALAEPMTFMNREGKQLLVIATGGAAYMGGVGPVQQSSSGKIIAFGLPSKPGAVKK